MHFTHLLNVHFHTMLYCIYGSIVHSNYYYDHYCYCVVITMAMQCRHGWTQSVKTEKSKQEKKINSSDDFHLAWIEPPQKVQIKGRQKNYIRIYEYVLCSIYYMIWIASHLYKQMMPIVVRLAGSISAISLIVVLYSHFARTHICILL